MTRKTDRHSSIVAAVLLLAAPLTFAGSLVLVHDGVSKVAIWHRGDAVIAGRGRARYDAAKTLADYLEKITGARPEVKTVAEGETPSADAPAIAVGKLAFELGLPAPPETVSGDGYRILKKGNRLLIAGETGKSSFYAASHFLETLGCRWFFGGIKLGTVVPKRKTIAVDDLDVAEEPDFISRSIWGPNWHHGPWHVHNRLGGLRMSTGHSWGWLPPKKYGKEHPEYYSLRGGERRPGNWLCTSNPDVQRIAAEALAASVAGKGLTSVSVSPPDGTGFCYCDKCCALDDPTYKEPSSGRTVMTDRYMHFFNALGREVLKANPDAILNFYAYSDYSRAPKLVKTAPDNLCVWMAPIRFCRLHSLSSPLCEPRQRLRQELDNWQQVVSKLGWREYNYNLAECIAPFSKISIWKDDIPYLHKIGCLGLNIECLYFWHLYGPHTYLIARLAWDADADVQAIMDDFYGKFCGKAAPHVKAYWERIDAVYRDTNAHVGSFYALHVIWTPELIEASQADLTAAAKAADSDIARKRVEMFQLGLDNIKYYLSLRDATNRCDFVKAKQVYDEWIKHMDAILAAGLHRIGEYKYGYVPRFLGKTVNDGYAKVTGDNKLLAPLPDEWQFRYDVEEEGEAKGWHRPNVASEGWRKVKTYSATLLEQGIGEVLTWLWYRTEVEVPEVPADRRAFLWFGEVDGRTTDLWLNGEHIGSQKIRRRPGQFEVTGKLRKGRNLVVARVDHRAISELYLGGIIKPVMIYTSPRGESTTPNK